MTARRVAMISWHTSPLAAPGSGDAGGMNVYVAEVATQLGAQGVAVDVYTQGPPGVTAAPGYRVVSLPAGPTPVVAKEQLPGHVAQFAAAVLTAGHGPYDVVHSHYWLSGEVASVLAAAWHVPVVHTMHTMAAVKNAAAGSADEPEVRVTGERRLARSAAALVVSTPGEGHDLVSLYGSAPERIHVVPPGVDLATFHPGPATPEQARAAVGLPTGPLLLFVGRIQPHKGPDLLVRALASMRRRGLPVPWLVLVGGPSGSGTADPAWLQQVAVEARVADRVITHGPLPRASLPQWYRAADLVVVPSRHESFGLVALEAQACGTPVVAAAVGGLNAAVLDGRSGLLVAGRDPDGWADALAGLLGDDPRRAQLAAGARRHAESFSWAATARGCLAVYEAVTRPLRPRQQALDVLRAFLVDAGLDHAPGARPGELVVSLPGEHRLVTTVSLLVGAHTVSATAFVCRRPDSDAAGVHEWLLRRNATLPGVAFAVDGLGDIYLSGRVPRSAVLDGSGADVLDALLGAVGRSADESFDEILRRGFGPAIARERAWRESRGLSTANLTALAGPTGPGTGDGGDLPGLGHD